MATGTKYPDKINAIISLSGQFYPELRSDFSHKVKGQRIFISHGTQDQVLPYASMKVTSEEFEKSGMNVSTHWYPSQHSISNDNLKDLLSWLNGLYK